MPEQDQELRDLGWCFVELMGHRKTGARVREEVLFGVVMCRCDIPEAVVEGQPEKWMTQFYGGASIYALHPTTEVVARAVAARFTAPPVHRYELALPVPTPAYRDDPDEDDDGDTDFSSGEDAADF